MKGLMFKSLLIAALGLIGALTAQAASSIIINSVPFAITAPGYYVLASDLTLPPGMDFGAAITVSTFTGTAPITIDFQGHTLIGPGPATATVTTGPGINDIVNNSSAIVIIADTNNLVAIRNGTISNFQSGVRGGSYDITVTCTVDSMIFNLPQGANGVSFECPFNCSVTNSTFNANGSGSSGIVESQPFASDTYKNNTFNGVTTPLYLGLFFDGGLGSIVVDYQSKKPKQGSIVVDCQLGPPKNPKPKP